MNRTSNINTKLNISRLISQDYSFASAILSTHYQYDALYRLIQATGRELTSLAMPSHEDFPNNIPCPNPAANAMQNYTQNYKYDELGNIKKIKNISSANTWVRRYEYDAATNRLLKHQGTVEQYTYDAHGNMLSMPHLSSMQWDEKDQLHSATAGTLTSYYNYDAQGNRTRKVVEKGNIIETRYYFNGYEIFRKEVNGDLDFERTTLNIADDEKTFVCIETKTGESPVIRYQYDNHLGSACLELDDTGDIISYEEYHPFGTTSYRSGRSEIEVSLKRYKYCGKERDEETGLYYYGMRYYAAWLCRFVSVDPLQFKYPYYTPYQYAGNKPVSFIDLDGGEPDNKGEYEGQGGIAPKLDENNKPISETENQWWTWSNNQWNLAEVEVTNAELVEMFPKEQSEALKELEIAINTVGEDYGLDSQIAIAHFLSQVGHEAGGFAKGLGSTESLNYSVSGLVNTFPNYFYLGKPVEGKYNAELYGRKEGQSAKQEAIANIVYANRMGNGDVASGEGYLYRGRGIIQLTGKDNYSAFNKYMKSTTEGSPDFVKNPQLLTTNKYAVESALWFFKTRVASKINLNTATVEQVTYKVNGGDNGIEDRRSKFNRITKVFNK
jgi:RHS repeat-associated protein